MCLTPSHIDCTIGLVNKLRMNCCEGNGAGGGLWSFIQNNKFKFSPPSHPLLFGNFKLQAKIGHETEYIQIHSQSGKNIVASFVESSVKVQKEKFCQSEKEKEKFQTVEGNDPVTGAGLPSK